MPKVPLKYLNRKEEIFRNYLHEIDKHIDDVLEGRVEEMFELRDLAALLFIHPTHLSNVIKQHTGLHPCYFYEEKLIAVAKNMLADPELSIADVARKLTYDPSNFTKWFKFFEHVTPSQYRKQLYEQTFAEMQATAG
ncbi:AraC family transcriptional regulator [Mucilaginibacter sp. JRF]|jgi:AraC-like DNA-binding protein|uniref:helix-turn-helix domain-containing protein n=1 Tax=Mucilaginibacter sp. JRF TaxID=2780088 RepID=UPI001880314F|nr:AraC family transcriptional regulator [Mucilaginibacter sp. JRF]MBE9584970.1 AraC family transcriptional regulator [Mucilaginibacter sp. JRF]